MATELKAKQKRSGVPDIPRQLQSVLFVNRLICFENAGHVSSDQSQVASSLSDTETTPIGCGHPEEGLDPNYSS